MNARRFAAAALASVSLVLSPSLAQAGPAISRTNPGELIRVGPGIYLADAGTTAPQAPTGPHERYERRIVGGTPVDIGQLPWQVALAESPSTTPGNGYQRLICGGSLVTTTLVITAAHCVWDGPSGFRSAADFSVISGRTYLSSNEGTETPLATYHYFVDSQGMPLYDPYTAAWDAVLLELSAPASGVPVKIAGPSEHETWSRGRAAYASGWGATSESGGYPDGLLATEIVIYGPDCFTKRVDDPATSLCAGTALGDHDTCYGDSGGPLVVPLESGGARLVGDTSYGFGACGSLYAGAYGRLAADPMRTAFRNAAWSLVGEDIVGSGGQPPRTMSARQARENAWIWAEADCERDRFCRWYNATSCTASGSAWRCRVTEGLRRRRYGRYKCRRQVQISAAQGSIARAGVGRWRCR